MLFYMRVWIFWSKVRTQGVIRVLFKTIEQFYFVFGLHRKLILLVRCFRYVQLLNSYQIHFDLTSLKISVSNNGGSNHEALDCKLMVNLDVILFFGDAEDESRQLGHFLLFGSRSKEGLFTFHYENLENEYPNWAKWDMEFCQKSCLVFGILLV